MTVLERIKEYNEEQMINFLYHFARDTINHFASYFMTPDKESIKIFLREELPNDKN